VTGFGSAHPQTFCTTGAACRSLAYKARHTSVAMTLDIYASLFADDLDAVADGSTKPSRN
jgi:hypothetical protein